MHVGPDTYTASPSLPQIGSLIINGGDAQERELAQRLLDDFGRFPPAEDGAEIIGLVLDGASSAPFAPQSAAAPSSQHQPSKGLDLKEQGNTAFKKGDYQTAEQLFSRAILADHRQEAYFANRSAARLALKKYAEALQDTEICLDLSGGKSFKAWYRKGQALEGLIIDALANAQIWGIVAHLKVFSPCWQGCFRMLKRSRPIQLEFA